MKHLKMLGLATMAAAALIAFVGAGTASATTLTGVGGSVLGKGTAIHAVNSGTNTLTTSFKNIECKESTIAVTTSNETGPSILGSVTSWITSQCNCSVSVLVKGTLNVSWAANFKGSIKSSGAQVTASCSTIFGTVHCIYATNETELGTLTGGTTAKMDISSADIPRLSTSALCDESANWDATYLVDSPDTLNVIG